jgi:acetylornithine/succinyldiaminopimelate/putrescine aminotransferase
MNLNSKILTSLFDNDKKLKYVKTMFDNLNRSNKNMTLKNKNLQSNILNFYNKNTVSPYVPLIAKGPWIISNQGKLIYDTGGYGMLGYGHSPDWALNILKKEHVMANVMTPSYEQYLLTEKLKEKIGNPCPYEKFAFLNSGSEAMELAGRIMDTIGKKKKDSRKMSKYIVLKDSFHGRTSNASIFSDSCSNVYNNTLKSFGYHKMTETVEINNLDELRHKIIYILNNEYVLDGIIMEPVMGEGRPGIALDPEFYKLARSLTNELNAVLVIDSVQAGIRTNGCLSIVDYPSMKDCEAPDMEIFSKAINSGIYPLSVLGLKNNISKEYEVGTYGNTMCANPKALDIGLETLNRLDEEVSQNIVDQGHNFVRMLNDLKNRYPHIIEDVTGTGLLIAAHINDKYDVVGKNGLEITCRNNGLNVIHGGKNALRFTPHFLINENEIALIKYILIDVLKNHCN